LYNPALDGVRAFAVIAVMFDHTGIRSLVQGGRGVQAFFVLSGFLITSLLIAEWFDRGHINLGSFYMRRFLRLYPALVLVLIVTAGVVPLITPVPTPTTFGVLSVVFYFSNWNWALTGTNTALGYLPHMWSLAVEEQFYLLWPAVVICLLSLRKASRNLLIVSVGLAALSIIDAVVLVQDPKDPGGYRLLGTDVQGEYLMLGCGLAVAVARYQERVKVWLRRLVWPGVAAMVALVVPWTFGSLPNQLSFLNDLRAAGQFSLFGLGSAVVIGYLHFANPRSVAMRIMSFTPFVMIGRISYGVYLWHFPVFVIVNGALGWRPLNAQVLALEFAITFAVAAISFAFFERPLLRLKDRLKPQGRRAPSVLTVSQPSQNGQLAGQVKRRPVRRLPID
jgi:peptidoglycan/LPS O-acetylase OafA/YrhL